MSKKTTSKAKKRPQKKAILYTLEIFLLGGPIPESFAGQVISRTIQIRGNQTLEDLHHAIFEAFERFDEHLYEFQFGKGPHDPDGPRYNLGGNRSGVKKGVPVGCVRETTIDSLKLEEDSAFGYWFDFGDDWMHQINVEAIEDAPPRKRFPKVIAKKGMAPPQYPDLDE